MIATGSVVDIRGCWLALVFLIYNSLVDVQGKGNMRLYWLCGLQVIVNSWL